MAAEYHPDLVLTDLAMPRLDGLEMARRLRQRAETRNVPIIAVSGQLVGDTTRHSAPAQQVARMSRGSRVTSTP